MTINRREFLKKGGLAAGAAIASSVLLESFTEKKMMLQSALDHFKVTESDLKKVIAIAMGKGGDYADLFFEHSAYNSLSLMDGEVNATSSNIDFGMGVRVVKGEQSGYAFTEIISLESMFKAAKTAALIADSNAVNFIIPETNELIFKGNYYPLTSPWDKFTVKEKKPYLQKLNDKIFALDKSTDKVWVSQSDTVSHILFFNSEGTLSYDYRPMVTFSAYCIMNRNDKSENAYASRSYRMGTEFLTEDLVDILAAEVVRKVSLLFDAVKPKGGEMPVVLGAGGSGILLHEAIGHAFEADFNRKKTSIFSDKLGQKVCNENITVVDDGTIAFNRGAVNIDDEGVLGQKTYIVKDGRLNSYLHDRISAKYFGVKPTGNGRRESFKNMPMPRMRVTYMENGNMKEPDLISSVEKGVFVDDFSNGQVQIGAGDFTFFVKSGYLIEKGKLTQPIKDINIIGNGPKALADITMVADNLKLDNSTWTCGKNGQGCPVTQGMPSVLVSKLTVGGES